LPKWTLETYPRALKTFVLPGLPMEVEKEEVAEMIAEVLLKGRPSIFDVRKVKTSNLRPPAWMP
jgi:hypothetical protein